MRRVILNEQEITVTIDKLIGNELIAYKCASSSPAVCILAKIASYCYGFVPLNCSDCKPRYEGTTWKEAVINAARERELYTFKSQDELIEAIYNKRLT